MTVEEAIKNKEFLDLLDSEDSYTMAHYLSKLPIPRVKFKLICAMFKDLGIFQDIALPGCEPTKNYKYILTGAITKVKKGASLDLRGSYIFSHGVDLKANCEIVIDDKTFIEDRGINLTHQNDYKLTFLGVPQCIKDSIYIFGNTTQLFVDNDIYSQIVQLIKENKINVDNDEIIKNIIII